MENRFHFYKILYFIIFQALVNAGLDEKSMHESKAARRLFYKVNNMINQLDPLVSALNKEKESLQRKIDDHKPETGDQESPMKES